MGLGDCTSLCLTLFLFLEDTFFLSKLLHLLETGEEEFNEFVGVKNFLFLISVFLFSVNSAAAAEVLSLCLARLALCIFFCLLFFVLCYSNFLVKTLDVKFTYVFMAGKMNITCYVFFVVIDRNQSLFLRPLYAAVRRGCASFTN